MMCAPLPLQRWRQSVSVRCPGVEKGCMIALRLWCAIAVASALSITARETAAQTAVPSTEGQFNPEIDAHVEVSPDVSLLSFAGVQDGEGYPYSQWYAAAGMSYRFQRIRSPHLINIDPDKEAYLFVGFGYEYLTTTQSGVTTTENRLALAATPGTRLFGGKLLVRDRNRLELRWVNGKYQTTYRNQLSGEWDFLVGGVRFTPYGSVEAFDNSRHGWNEWWYTAGVQFPFGGRHWMLDAYFRRQDCSTCTPAHWNAAGLTLNYYCDVPEHQY
jgi:hypothetical protein